MKYILILCAVLFVAAVVLFLVARHYWQKARAQSLLIDLQADTIEKLGDSNEKLKEELKIEARHTRELGEEIARIKRLSIDDVMRGLS